MRRCTHQPIWFVIAWKRILHYQKIWWQESGNGAAPEKEISGGARSCQSTAPKHRNHINHSFITCRVLLGWMNVALVDFCRDPWRKGQMKIFSQHPKEEKVEHPNAMHGKKRKRAEGMEKCFRVNFLTNSRLRRFPEGDSQWKKCFGRGHKGKHSFLSRIFLHITGVDGDWRAEQWERSERTPALTPL